MADIRIDVEMFTNPKILKLQRIFGAEGVNSLIRLWAWAAKHRPSGSLAGMDDVDIEIAAGIDNPDFTPALVDLRLLDRGDDGSVSIHQWTEHNPWAADAPRRSNQNRLVRLAAVYPELYTELVAKGITELTPEQYRAAVDEWTNRRHETQRNVNATSTPIPAPIPVPNPNVANIGQDPAGLSTDCPQVEHNIPTKAGFFEQEQDPAPVKDGQEQEQASNAAKELQRCADSLSRSAAKGVFLQHYRRFPGYQKDEPEREEAWVESLYPILQGLDIGKEFVNAIAWIHKKHFIVRSARAFIVRWFKRVSEERRHK